MNTAFWSGKRVFITGHTGFKGGWLSLLLKHIDAEIIGYSLAQVGDPNFFEVTRVAEEIVDLRGDIRNLGELRDAVATHKPDIVIHMAAQSLVRESYRAPVETFDTNVMGTVNLLEAVRFCPSVRAVVIVTSDKCYENRDRPWGYREDDVLGGYDPYSSSKACSELVASAYRQSFFGLSGHAARIASARAGNVIGGGDWAIDRLIPDMVRAIEKAKPVHIRNPEAIRPWQHVLEPLSGYLTLAQRLYEGDSSICGGWNFGPNEVDARPVRWIADRLINIWGEGLSWIEDQEHHPHEAHYLKLDCSKTRTALGWMPRWSLEQALTYIVQWHRAHQAGGDMRSLTLNQIDSYISATPNELS